MLSWLRQSVDFVDRINDALATGIRWLALAMVLTTLVVVVMRYAFATSTIVLQESILYMHAMLFMLGIPYGIKQDTHVRVDIVYAKLTDSRKNWVNLIGHVLFLLPISGFIFITSLPYVQASWAVLEGSPEVGGIPAVFLLKSLIPVMATLLFCQGLSQIVKCICNLQTDRS